MMYHRLYDRQNWAWQLSTRPYKSSASSQPQKWMSASAPRVAYRARRCSLALTDGFNRTGRQVSWKSVTSARCQNTLFVTVNQQWAQKQWARSSSFHTAEADWLWGKCLHGYQYLIRVKGSDESEETMDGVYSERSAVSVKKQTMTSHAGRVGFCTLEHFGTFRDDENSIRSCLMSSWSVPYFSHFYGNRRRGPWSLLLMLLFVRLSQPVTFQSEPFGLG